MLFTTHWIEFSPHYWAATQRFKNGALALASEPHGGASRPAGIPQKNTCHTSTVVEIRDSHRFLQSVPQAGKEHLWPPGWETDFSFCRRSEKKSQSLTHREKVEFLRELGTVTVSLGNWKGFRKHTFPLCRNLLFSSIKSFSTIMGMSSHGRDVVRTFYEEPRTGSEGHSWTSLKGCPLCHFSSNCDILSVFLQSN